MSGAVTWRYMHIYFKTKPLFWAFKKLPTNIRSLQSCNFLHLLLWGWNVMPVCLGIYMYMCGPFSDMCFIHQLVSVNTSCMYSAWSFLLLLSSAGSAVSSPGSVLLWQPTDLLTNHECELYAPLSLLVLCVPCKQQTFIQPVIRFLVDGPFAIVDFPLCLWFALWEPNLNFKGVMKCLNLLFPSLLYSFFLGNPVTLISWYTYDMPLRVLPASALADKARKVHVCRLGMFDWRVHCVVLLSFEHRWLVAVQARARFGWGQSFVPPL